MGPAHSLSAQVGTRVGNSNPARREILLGCNICFLTQKKPTLFGRCRAHRCKGRINSLKPEGHFSFVCLVVSPWLLWEGVFKWEGWCKITRNTRQTVWLKIHDICPPRLRGLHGKPGPWFSPPERWVPGQNTDSKWLSVPRTLVPSRYQNVHLQKDAAGPDPAPGAQQAEAAHTATAGSKGLSALYRV